jgi:hypothetical protein
MDCTEVEARLNLLLDDELDEAQVAPVVGHLSICASCRGKRLLLGAVRNAIQKLPTETVSSDFAPAFRQRLAAERLGTPGGDHRWSSPRHLVLALAAAALALVLWSATTRNSGAPSAVSVATEVPPGLDCGLDSYVPPPCASPEVCGTAEAGPEALTLVPRQTACTTS